MFQSNKSYREIGTVDKQIWNMIYIIKRPRFSNKRPLNQIRKRYSNTVKTYPREEDLMDVVFERLQVPIPQAVPEEMIPKKTRNNGYNWDKPKKEKKIDSIRGKAKGGYFSDIPHDVTAWTLRDSINSDWLDEQVKRV